MPTITQDEAIADLPQLIDAAMRSGEEIIVTRDQTAVVKIVPVIVPAPSTEQPRPPRQPGSARGLISMREDFDNYLELQDSSAVTA